VLVAGRGGWPAWLDAPELHIAALVVVLASTQRPVWTITAGKRRALIALSVGIGCTAIALAAVAMKHGAAEDAIGRALVDGGISLACLGIALVLAWRTIAPPLVYVLLLLSSVSTVPSTAPTTDRDVVEVPQAFATAAIERAGVAPLRVFRPVFMNDGPMTLDEALATPARRPTWSRRRAQRIRRVEAPRPHVARSGAVEPSPIDSASTNPRFPAAQVEPLARGSRTPAARRAGRPVMRGALWSADPRTR
jgi:hypothetical protein